MLVSVADAVVDEDAVVVHFGYAVFAYTAMFRAGGFQEFAGLAFLAWVEDSEIVGVERHLMRMIFRSDVARVTVG